jgi:hypothetical protein
MSVTTFFSANDTPGEMSVEIVSRPGRDRLVTVCQNA